MGFAPGRGEAPDISMHLYEYEWRQSFPGIIKKTSCVPVLTPYLKVSHPKP